MRARLRVKTLFKHEDDDDDSAWSAGTKDKKAKDDDDQDFFDVWTSFDDHSGIRLTVSIEFPT